MTISYLRAVSSPIPDTTYGEDDSIEVKFSEDTSMGGKRMGQLLRMEEVNAMFNFPCSLGSYYVGKWETRQIFIITIWDPTGACDPILGWVSLSVNKTGNIRNYPPQSAPNEAQSPTLTGDFGPSPLQILSVRGESSPIADDVYGSFDTLTLTMSHDSDLAGMETGSIISQATLLSLFQFNVSLGVFFYGIWTGPRELKFFIEDADDATPPSLPCDPGATVCVGEANTIIGRFKASGNLRSVPLLTAPVVAIAPKLSGSFGVSTLKFKSIVAVAGYRNDTNDVYGESDMINITFNQPTNKGFLPDFVSQTMLTNLFGFSMPIGYDFYGEWMSRDNLVITIRDEAGAGPPTIGGLTLEVKFSGNLMAQPPVTSRATPKSGTLLGNFGPSPIRILSVTASDSTDDDQVYSNEDFITIIFSQNTDKGRPRNNPRVSQYELESMFEFSQNIGTSFWGLWINFKTLRITISDVTGAAPPVLDQLTVRVRPCRSYDSARKICQEDFEYCAHCDCCLGDLRNNPRTSAPTAIASPTLVGNFGPCAFGIINITAFDAKNYDSTLDDGDAIMIYFTEPTDKACGRLYQAASCQDGKVLNKAQVDNLLRFSHFIATNYSAVWHSPTQLELRLIDVTNSEARIGELYLEVPREAIGDGELPGLRNVPPVCGPQLIQSQPVLGNWGLAPPFIDEFVARRAAGEQE